MDKNLNSRKSKLLFISFVLLITLLTFLAVRQSFNLALSGDDWLMHYTNWSIFDVRKEGNFLNPLSLFCTYCPNNFFLLIISRIWGYDPFYYYLASFLSRTSVAIILFFLVRKLTGRKLPAVLTSCFFAVSYLGIETTDWVFNYNHYLGVGVVGIFLIRYFKAKETKKIKDIITAGFLFTLALIISPPRMHGLLPLIMVIEIGWLLLEEKRYNFKKLIERIGIILGFYFIVIRGVSDVVSFLRDHSIHLGAAGIIGGYGTSMYSQTINQGLTTMKTYMSQGKTDFIIDPIASLGNFIMPGLLWIKIPFSTSLLFISLVFGGLTSLMLYLAGLKNKVAPFYVFNLFVYLTVIYFLQISNTDTFLYPRVAFALVGGFTIIFTIWLFFLLKKTKPLLAHTVLLSLGWMFTFILFPWFLSPASGIMLAWGRYSIQQAAGLSIWTATILLVIIDSLKVRGRKFSLAITYFAILLFILMHLSFTNSYLAQVNTYRSKELDQKYWTIITSEAPTIDKNGQNIFLLLTDPESGQIAEAIRFGFFGRSILHYNVINQNYNPIMVVNEYEGILSVVYDGKFLAKHGHPNAQPIPVDHIYAFLLQNKEMYNVTSQVRKKLTEDLEALKQGSRLPPQIAP